MAFCVARRSARGLFQGLGGWRSASFPRRPTAWPASSRPCRCPRRDRTGGPLTGVFPGRIRRWFRSAGRCPGCWETVFGVGSGGNRLPVRRFRGSGAGLRAESGQGRSGRGVERPRGLTGCGTGCGLQAAGGDRQRRPAERSGPAVGVSQTRAQRRLRASRRRRQVAPCRSTLKRRGAPGFDGARVGGRRSRPGGRPRAQACSRRGAVGDRQARGHGQDQQVPGHAHGVRATRAAPLPAAPLEAAEALLDPVAAGVEGGPGVRRRGVGQQDPGVLAIPGVQHNQRAGQGVLAEGLARPTQNVPGPPPSDRTGTRSPPVGRKVTCGE